MHFSCKRDGSFLSDVSIRWSAWGRCGAPDLSWGQGQGGVFDPEWGGWRCQTAPGWEKCPSQGIRKWKLCRPHHPGQCHGETWKMVQRSVYFYNFQKDFFFQGQNTDKRILVTECWRLGPKSFVSQHRHAYSCSLRQFAPPIGVFMLRLWGARLGIC